MPPLQRIKLMMEAIGVQVAAVNALVAELEQPINSKVPYDPPPPTPSEQDATEPQRKYVNVLLAKARKANIEVQTPFGTPFEWVMSKGEASQIINRIKAEMGDL